MYLVTKHLVIKQRLFNLIAYEWFFIAMLLIRFNTSSLGS